ncbi:Hypothetical protein AA314_07881 [Archangium gephyra]|uniref:Uncharacterized protein n=1 Tax=Archangium gephyra TaxID=48 RepID=A0AAC8THV2_9BACT|nr:Hypothetical protein AA314_07881 [Archangium gephyra]
MHIRLASYFLVAPLTRALPLDKRKVRAHAPRCEACGVDAVAWPGTGGYGQPRLDCGGGASEAPEGSPEL